MQFSDCRTPITGRPDANYDCFEIMQRKGGMQNLHYFDPHPIPRTARAPRIKSSLILKEGCPVLEAPAGCVFPAAWQKNKAISLFLQNPCLRISVRPRCTGKPRFQQQSVASSHTNSPLRPQSWPKPDPVPGSSIRPWQSSLPTRCTSHPTPTWSF